MPENGVNPQRLAEAVRTALSLANAAIHDAVLNGLRVELTIQDFAWRDVKWKAPTISAEISQSI